MDGFLAKQSSSAWSAKGWRRIEWIEDNGAAKFKDAILDVAGDLDDLKHITEQDFEEFVKGMPKLKARRLRASLVELGARLA